MQLLIYSILIYWVAVNVVTFALFGIDKRKAQQSKWRIEESTLLLWAAFGGSVGALLGMKVWHESLAPQDAASQVHLGHPGDTDCAADVSRSDRLLYCDITNMKLLRLFER